MNEKLHSRNFWALLFILHIWYRLTCGEVIILKLVKVLKYYIQDSNYICMYAYKSLGMYVHLFAGFLVS